MRVIVESDLLGCRAVVERLDNSNDWVMTLSRDGVEVVPPQNLGVISLVDAATMAASNLRWAMEY